MNSLSFLESFGENGVLLQSIGTHLGGNRWNHVRLVPEAIRLSVDDSEDLDLNTGGSTPLYCGHTLIASCREIFNSRRLYVLSIFEGGRCGRRFCRVCIARIPLVSETD